MFPKVSRNLLRISLERGSCNVMSLKISSFITGKLGCEISIKKIEWDLANGPLQKLLAASAI